MQVWQAGGACFEGQEQRWFSWSTLRCSPSSTFLSTPSAFKGGLFPLAGKASHSEPLDNAVTSTGPDFMGRFCFFLPLTKKVALVKAKSVCTQ